MNNAKMSYYSDTLSKLNKPYDKYKAGNRLNERRKFCGYTEESLSEELEATFGLRTTRQTISKIESGGGITKVDLLLALSILLGCDPQYLLGWCDTLRAKDTPVAELLVLDNEAVNILTQLKSSKVGKDFGFIMSEIIKSRFFVHLFDYCSLSLDPNNSFIDVGQGRPQVRPSDILAGKQAQLSGILIDELSKIRTCSGLLNYDETDTD